MFSHDKSDVLELADILKESQKQVCRLVREYAGEALLSRLSLAGNPLATFVETVRVFDDLSKDRLFTTAEDDRVRNDSLSEAKRRNERTSNDLRKFKAELEQERTKREREVSEKDESLTRLDGELAFLQAKSKSEIQGFNRLSSEREASQQALYEQKLEEWREHIDKLRSELRRAREENGSLESELRQDKIRKENELHLLLKNYDTEMETMTVEHSELTSLIERDSEELAFLQTELEKLQQEAESRAERVRLEDEEKKGKDEVEKRIHDSATAIQSLFRGYLFRNKPKKGKRGGKGGKRGR